MSFDYDLLVIEARPGEIAAAERVANHGAKVAIAAGRAFANTEFGNKLYAVDYEDIPYVVSD